MNPAILFLLLFCHTTQTTGVIIESQPSSSVDVVQVGLRQSVSLACRPDDVAQNEEELVWLRNGEKIKLMEENKKGESKVCISPAIYDDNGATFTCYLQSNSSDVAFVTLNVTYHPELNGSEEVTIEEEESLVLQCDMRANPLLSSMLWTLNGSMVDLLAGGFTVTSDGFTSVLQARRVEKSVHGGTYKCTATSPSAGVHSKLFHVIVTEKTIKFPLMPTIAGLVVVFLTALLAVVSRWKKITKCCK
ncbi:transmembrane and immunoglobulin domain-containing protein 1 [Nothobranchius furzeri]|uniref:Transcript variant X1 n=1 Tax=Nothobranchius furzeri TaxID=105023 RepID=A0A9D3BE50_NOTFU|nr:transmembrane and immunoglobulin domain-containing protein 1 [Nothobranchius furzeri]KAF7206556.1 transcript variant X1 [Nothobranchius furzeri]KAF7206557.1 transcript variant X2 [Nothobranchius furzeri]